MAVKLRLRRMGKKKQPIYKVVAADTRSPRDGKFLEALGLYNPLTDPHTVEIKEDRVLYWLDNGAQPTNTVKSLLRQKGITLKRELGKKGLDAEKVETELENWKKLKEASSKKKTVKKKSKKQASSEKSEDKAVEEKPVETVAKEVGSTEESKPEEKKTTEESTTEVKGAASEEKEVEKE